MVRNPPTNPRILRGLGLSIHEDEELIVPSPGLLHPSAGTIPRRDAEVGRITAQGMNSVGNGTVTSASPTYIK